MFHILAAGEGPAGAILQVRRHYTHLLYSGDQMSTLNTSQSMGMCWAQKRVATACSLLAVLAQTVSAGTIIEQLPTGTLEGAFTSYPFGQLVATGFSLSSAAEVTAIDWYAYWQNSPADPDQVSGDFRIQVFENNGSVGTLLFSQTFAGVTGASTGVFANNWYWGDQLILKFSATVTPFTLAAGDYWISMASDIFTSGQILWARESGPYKPHASGADGQPWSSFPWYGHAFALQGTSSGVPEGGHTAATFAVALVMLLGLGGAGFQHRSGALGR